MKKLIYILSILLFTSYSFSATYHINQAGSGTQTGASEANADTVAEFNANNINNGAGSMAAGDIIYFYGTITTGLVLPVSGTSGNPIVLDGYAADDTTYMSLSEVTGRAKIDVTTSTRGIDVDGQDYIEIVDFEITDFSTAIKLGTSASVGIVIKRNYMYEGDSGVYIGNGANIVTVGGVLGHGNVIKNIGIGTSGEDIAIDGNSHDIIISYNHLYADSTDWGIDGVMCVTDAYNVLVEYNSIHDHNHSTAQGENGIDIKRDAYDWIIRYNRIYNHTYESDIILNGRYVDPNEDSADRIYIYGNLFYGGGDPGVHSQTNTNNFYDDIYIFSNVFQLKNNDALKLAAPGNYHIFNNVFAECSQVGASNTDAGFYQGGTGAIIKNNVFYKNRPNDISYNQLSIGDAADENTTSDYNIYWWPGPQTSSVYWGNAGNKTVAELATMGGVYGNQDVNSSDEDPGLTDIANQDFRILSTGSAVYGAGVDMGSGVIATLTIQGTSYPVNWDDGIGPGTVWGSGSTLPVIEKISRDVIGWDIGAYGFGLLIYGISPIDNGTDVAIGAAISWTNPASMNTVDIYFEKISGACDLLIGDRVLTGGTQATYDPAGDMDVSSDYCWRVDILHDGGTETGTVYSFTTASGPPTDSTKKATIGYDSGGGSIKYDSGGMTIQ